MCDGLTLPNAIVIVGGLLFVYLVIRLAVGYFAFKQVSKFINDN